MLASLDLVVAALAVAAAPLPDPRPPDVDMHVVRATVGQMLALAQEMIARGKDRDAERILELLSENPDLNVRSEARFRRAMLLRARRQDREAALLLRHVVDDNPRAVAARLKLAETLQSLGDIGSALREVRAVQSTGLPPAVARLVDRYSLALRAVQPVGASLTIAVAPDSNVNHATRSDTLGTVFGDFQIAEEAKAKSGTGLSLNAQAFRRVAISDDANVLIRASGLANLYPHSRFNDVVADLAAGPELILGRDQFQVELGVSEHWFGQKPYMRSARVAASFSHSVGRRTLLRLSGSTELIDNQFNDLEDGKSFSGRLQIERALTSTTGVAASLVLNRQALKDPGYSTRAWRGGLTAWKDLGRTTLTASAEFGRLQADERLWLFPDRREDRYSRFAIGAALRQVEMGGFRPLLQFSIERNRSSVGFYDYRRARAEIGIDRAF